MATMKQMAEEYRIAAEKLEMRIEEKRAMGVSGLHIGKLRSALKDIREVQQLLENYYTAPRDTDYTDIGWIGAVEEREYNDD